MHRILYNSWDAHYRQINVLRFTHDGAALLSGSDDSGVSVWSVSRLLDDESQNEPPTPYCTLSDHTLPVTDIVCGTGPFPACRALTSSVDHSVKLWDLSSRSLLTTFQFPKAISCIAWDSTERIFFAASPGPEGSIHQVNLFTRRPDHSAGGSIEAVGGAGVADTIRVGDEDPKTRRKRLISVGQPITSICISLTASNLLVGTSAGIIQVYDIPSHQLLRSISSYKDKGLSINHLATLLKPPDLIGHISLSLGSASGVETMPVKPILPFQRMKDAKSRDAHEVSLMLPIQSKTPSGHFDLSYDPMSSEFLRDHAFFVQAPSTTAAGNAQSLQARVTSLESEVVHLREQLGKAKGVNDVMWETVVQKVIPLAQGKEKSQSTSINRPDDGDSERKKKRGRN
ncbi:hypothetical protein HWV62_19401 [Athelia sp. TMB]|nr:hypothetical protein HWV62_19401 [Athelia sp. TMB]